MAHKANTVVSVYLLARRGDEICMLLRQNTGYCDGQYGLIAGHVEDGESALAGMIREANEEAGINLDPSHLRPVHAMHRRSPDRINIDLFFEANSWMGAIVNNEPNKCAHVAFFPLNKIPENTMGYVAKALRYIQQGVYYSEEGWT